MKDTVKFVLITFYLALLGLMVIFFRHVQAAEDHVFLVPLLLFVLVGSSVYLFRWIHGYVLMPIRELKKTIGRIEEGDVDYILDIDQDDEMGELCREVDKMRMTLKADRAQREQFIRENRELVRNISHDLKTPITAIKGYCEGLIDGVADSPEKVERYIRTIYNKTNDMDRLIDELSYYTKIDTNKIPYSFEAISPVDFFEDCAVEVGLDLESRGVIFTMTNHVAPEVKIIADGEQLKKVVNNIISNSLKYFDKTPGRIDIRLLDDGDFVKVEIEDNGKGIAAADLPYIFDRFYRTDASRGSKTGGSGIGLSIVRKIIEDHGGKIWAAGTLGEGTTIIFIIRKYQEVRYEQNTDSRR